MQLNFLSVRPRQVSFTHGGCHGPCCRWVSPFKDTDSFILNGGASAELQMQSPPPERRVGWRHHPPSSQRKSGRATSCRGISFRKPGRWQRGLPVTIFLLLNQSPSQASRQSQLKELAKRLLRQKKKKEQLEKHGQMCLNM